MLSRGIPESAAEALAITEKIADLTPNDPAPLHWPHSQVVAIAQLVRDQQETIATQSELIEMVMQRCDYLKRKIIEIQGGTDDEYEGDLVVPDLETEQVAAESSEDADAEDSDDGIEDTSASADAPKRSSQRRQKATA